MAIYHCHISNVSRAKGSSACATYAYISGEKVFDERLQKTFSYARQERILSTGTVLPENAPAEYADPKTMFNDIEKSLTADNARIAKKIEVALPDELDLSEQKEIVEKFIRDNLTSHGYPCTYAIHDGHTHAHILIANRPINERGEWLEGQTKSVFANDRDKNGKPIFNPQKPCYDPHRKEETEQYRLPKLGKDGKQKFRERKGKGKEMLWERVNITENDLDNKEFLCHLRKEWAAECNKHLAPDHQIDHRSNAERGIEDKPTIHEGYAARAIEAQGGISERCQENREIRAENEQRREIKAELAAARAEDEALERKERELHERLRNIGRRKNDETTGRTPDGERAITSTVKTYRATNPDNQRAREQADRASRLNSLIERREREAAEIRRGREEAARREREAEEAKRRAREEAKAKRERDKSIKQPEPDIGFHL